MNIKYIQPNMEKIIKEYDSLLVNFNKVKNIREQLVIIEKINIIREDFLSMYWLSYINYLLDLKSKYWKEQVDFFAINNPIINNYRLKYYRELTKSKFRNELINSIGSKVFKIAEIEISLLSDSIIEEKKRDKELSNLYRKIISTTKVEYDGSNLTLKQLSKYLVSKNREVRINASKAESELMESIKEQIDNIFDELVTIRTSIANKLNFESYSDYSYKQMKRIGYDKEDIKKFRNEVIAYIVPKVNNIKIKQKEELDIDKLMYYDNEVLFKDGNPTPKGDINWILDQTKKMYKKIDPKLYYLFNKMVEDELFDVKSRDNKSDVGLTAYIPIKKTPIFIANFNGTSSDIQVLIHEFGHSFQLYSSRNLKYHENWWPTFDACEIHSKTMELLTLPYMDIIFKEDKEKFVKEKLNSILEGMCKICLVDEFQNVIYDNPTLSINDRKNEWNKLQNKYLPWLNFGDNSYLSEGNMWQQQQHIFSSPFYYIDYALANIVALQFYYMSLNNQGDTWNKYIEFCSFGGTYTFIDSIKKVGLKSPFENGVIKEVITKM